MSEEKDFFKTCFNTVAGLEVKNESQAIAKEVVLSEIETLEQQCKKYKELIDKAIEIISKEFLCYDNESDEYIQGIKVLDILKEVE